MIFITRTLILFSSAGHLTAKSDVYSFGVVLLEMLSGRRVVDKNRPTREQNLVEWAKPYLKSKRKVFQVMDTRLEGRYSLNEALKVAQLALQCIASEPRQRPTMVEVVRSLDQLQSSEDMNGATEDAIRRKHGQISSNANHNQGRTNGVRNGVAPAAHPKA